MTDRATIILATPAAAAFPALAAFLANKTEISPDVAELALQAACVDFAEASKIIKVNAGWAGAVDSANRQFSAQLISPGGETGANQSAISNGWGKAIANAKNQG